jgi:predicted transcriptional regulator
LKYGSNTLELLTYYARIFEADGDQEPPVSLGLERFRLRAQEPNSYRRFGKVDYVSLLRIDDNRPLDLPEETLRNLEILRSRAAGLTLEQVGNTFGLTREAIRQKISKLGGDDFKTYLEESKTQRQKTDEVHSLRVREYVRQHPGITAPELAMVFDSTQALVQGYLTKYERKLVSGAKPSRDRTQLWSDESILEALQLAQTYHYPLTTSGYQELIDVGEIRGPSVPLITTRFKTWKLACIAAGVEFVESLTTYSLTWSREDLIEILCQYLQDPTTSGSVTDYDAWREASTDRLPSRAQLRIVVGRWSEACDEALGAIRSNSWDAQGGL